MPKIYKDENVYDAAMQRIEFLFEEFEQILVAFSGGKDSGVMLNLCYEYARKNNLLHKLAMYHMDYEAQYQMTTDYVNSSFESFDGIRKFWLCLPVAAQCAINMEQSYWIPWEQSKEDIWVRSLPLHESVVHETNVEFPFSAGDHDYDTQTRFNKWFANKYGKTAVCIGLRTDESLNRFRAIASDRKINEYKGETWTNSIESNCTLAYPIYDWTTQDIWVANGRIGFEYNRLYDLFYEAGVPLHKMRVASPFNDSAIDSLKLYKVIDPNTWARMVGRVNGVNFAGIYGGTTAMGWKSIKLPEGHTWKSYLEFLLNTLPKQTRERYVQKFETSIKFWREKGGVLDEKTIQELRIMGISFKVKEETNYNTTKKPVTFREYPDDVDVTDFKVVPSYKRMCICIMKNDHLCKYMGFSQTKAETEKRKRTIEKYENIIRGK